MIDIGKVLIILAVNCLLLTTENVFSVETDTVRVSGVVTDEAGSLLVGATIHVKGTDINTSAGMNGKYALTVPKNAILKFLYLGLTPQEIAVDGQEVINVVMTEGMALEPAKPINLTVEQRKKAEADNRFAFKMFREVSKQQGDNTFFSPLSLNMALGMLYNGSSGNTRAEMVKALDMAGISENEANEYYQKVSRALLEIDPATDMVIANSIWYHDVFPVKNAFIETGKTYFDANVQAIDFTNRNAAGIINQWCADKTRNRINQIAANPIPGDMMMYLINALYFKSKWYLGQEFNDEKTKWDDFTKTGNLKTKVHLMEQTTTLSYYADQHLQCVELPYGNKAFSMVAILPPENTPVDRLIDYMPNVNWQNIIDSMKQQKVWLKLPRFKIECEFSLNQPVMNAGMKQIFEGDFANISNEPLWVSNITQKTFVEVNEKGTEASALTEVTLVTGGQRVSKPIEPVRFFADRPFLFLIRENSTGVILFVGRIDDPHE